jgi:hypothetical protein
MLIDNFYGRFAGVGLEEVLMFLLCTLLASSYLAAQNL